MEYYTCYGWNDTYGWMECYRCNGWMIHMDVWFLKPLSNFYFIFSQGFYSLLEIHFIHQCSSGGLTFFHWISLGWMNVTLESFALKSLRFFLLFFKFIHVVVLNMCACLCNMSWRCQVHILEETIHGLLWIRCLYVGNKQLVMYFHLITCSNKNMNDVGNMQHG
jgi:hypothetical protein